MGVADWCWEEKELCKGYQNCVYNSSSELCRGQWDKDNNGVLSRSLEEEHKAPLFRPSRACSLLHIFGTKNKENRGSKSEDVQWKRKLFQYNLLRTEGMGSGLAVGVACMTASKSNSSPPNNGPQHSRSVTFRPPSLSSHARPRLVFIQSTFRDACSGVGESGMTCRFRFFVEVASWLKQ